MYPYIIFNFLGRMVSVPSYNLLIGIGLVFAFLNLDFQFKKLKIMNSELDKLYMILTVTITCSFVFSAVFNNIVHAGETVQHQKSLFSGFTYLGGFAGGFILYSVLYFLLFKNKKTYMDYCNIAVTSLVLGHFWGRMGCYFAGCCFGKETGSFLGITFPKGSLPYSFYGEYVKIYPTQLFEAAFLICMYTVLVRNIKNALALYLLCYGIFRFLIEFLRGDNRGIILPTLSPSQLIAIIMAALGLFLIIRKRKVLLQ